MSRDSLDTTSELRHRIVFFGAGKVGKTSLIRRFLYDTFESRYKETIDDMFNSDFKVSGNQVNVDILDTSGQMSFPAMRRISISRATAFVLVLSTDLPDSLREARSLLQQVQSQRDDWRQVPLVVVLNKQELSEPRLRQEHVLRWLVDEELLNAFVETSAAQNSNVQLLFEMLLRQARELRVQLYTPKRHGSTKCTKSATPSTLEPSGTKPAWRSLSLKRRSSAKKKRESESSGPNNCVTT